MSVFRTNLTGKNRNTGRCRGVFGFLQFFKILTLYAQTWGRGLANIGQRDLHPPMGYPPPTPQEQAPTPTNTNTNTNTHQRKKIKKYRGTRCGVRVPVVGVPPPPENRRRCLIQHPIKTVTADADVSPFSPHNNPDGGNYTALVLSYRTPH